MFVCRRVFFDHGGAQGFQAFHVAADRVLATLCPFRKSMWSFLRFLRVHGRSIAFSLEQRRIINFAAGLWRTEKCNVCGFS